MTNLEMADALDYCDAKLEVIYRAFLANYDFTEKATDGLACVMQSARDDLQGVRESIADGTGRGMEE